MTENPLEEFLDGYSLDEIKQMLFALIEQVFPVMESPEKQDFILKMLGETGDDKLPSMVSRWIAECMDEGVDPKNLCRQIVTAIDENAALESLANPEIRTLFIDWMEELEKEILIYGESKGGISPKDLTDHFKISRQGAEFLIEKLKQEKKVQR